MKKRLSVTDWEQASLLFSEVRVDILDRCLARPHSIKDLAEATGLNPGTIHSHVKKLYGAGFLEIVQTRMINGIEEKKYAKVAEFFDLSALPAEAIPKRNDKVAHEVKKKIRQLMDVDPMASVKRVGALLHEDDIAHVRAELERLREFILSHQAEPGEGVKKCTWITALGSEESET